LDTAARAIDVLGPDGFADLLEPTNDVRPEKVVSESAILLLAASAASRFVDVADRIHELALAISPYARSDEILTQLCFDPIRAWDYAQAHVCLRRLGYDDARFDSVLSTVLDARVQESTSERPPNRMLEQAWTIAVAGPSRTPEPLSMAEIAQCSALGGQCGVLAANRHDMYAFTHAVMYLTDFGLNPSRLPRDRSATLADAEGMMGRCLDLEDYDLVGELVMCWPLTGDTWAPAAAFAFRVLAGVEDEAGFLPSPSLKLERLSSLEGEERSRYLLATCYHTVFVMGLLCAAALAADRPPPTDWSLTPGQAGASGPLLTLLDGCSERPRWREALDGLTARQKDRLAGLLLGIGLHRCVARRDVPGLREFLEVGYAYGLADAPIAGQAAELIRRLAWAFGDDREPPRDSTTAT
jgi:hypothetical protein